MAIFTIRYRRSDGGIAEKVIEAQSRADVFTQMQSEGLTPISVSVGGKKVRDNRQHQHPSVSGKSILKYCAAIGVIAVICGLAWLMLKDDGKAVKVAPKAKKTQVRVPAKADAPKEMPKIPEKKDIDKPIEKKQLLPTSIVEVISVRTNSTGAIIERYRRADGKTARRIRMPPPIFKTNSDSVLALIAQVKPGQSMAPLPADPITNEQFLESLNVPIIIEKDDSAEVKALKTAVVALRTEIKAMVDQGRSVNEILAEHQQITHHTEALHAEALKEVKRLIDSGDRKAAADYAVEINAKLEEWGLQQIHVPSEEAQSSPRNTRINKDQ